MQEQSEKWTSAGGVVVKHDESTGEPLYCLVLPSNNFGPWQFPKGRVDPGESLEDAALREVNEESGVVGDIIVGLGTGLGSHSITHYYLMDCVSESGVHDYETKEVRWVTYDEALDLLTGGGNSRDVGILNRALSKLHMLPEVYVSMLSKKLLR